MKLVRTDRETIGLLVQLPAGPHVVDIARSVGVFAAHDPVLGGLVNGALKERCALAALVNNWRYLRKPLELLARTALTNPDDPRLAIRPFAQERDTKAPPPGIVAIDITDAADLETHDPTGQRVVATQSSEAGDAPSQRDASSAGENVQVIDFSRRSEPRTRDSQSQR